MIFVMLFAFSTVQSCEQVAEAVALFDAIKKGYDRLSGLDLSKHPEWINVCEFKDFTAKIILNIDDVMIQILRDGDATNADVDITDDKLQHQEYDKKWCADVLVAFLPLFPKLANVSLNVIVDDFHIDWNAQKHRADFNFGRCHANLKSVDGSRSFNVYIDFGWADAYNYVREWVGYAEVTGTATTLEV